MTIDAITNGVVIDHIPAGKAMELYRVLGLEDMDCEVAIIKNATSGKMGKKDIIKISSVIDLDFDILGYISSEITVNIIKDGKTVEKRHPELPQTLKNVIFCHNPRCITSIEQELSHVFTLTDPENKVYRCIYCDTRA